MRPVFHGDGATAKPRLVARAAAAKFLSPQQAAIITSFDGARACCIIMEMPPESISKASVSEDARLRNYLNQAERRNDNELQAIQAKFDDELARMNDNHTHQVEKLRGAYDVQISEEAEALEDRLQHVRAQNEERLEGEKQMGEKEFDRLHAANRQRIEDYKKTSESQLDLLRKQLQASAEQLREQSRKSMNVQSAKGEHA